MMLKSLLAKEFATQPLEYSSYSNYGRLFCILCTYHTCTCNIIHKVVRCVHVTVLYHTCSILICLGLKIISVFRKSYETWYRLLTIYSTRIYNLVNCKWTLMALWAIFCSHNVLDTSWMYALFSLKRDSALISWTGHPLVMPTCS